MLTKCENMTHLGCERMDAVKELMLLNSEDICKNICCYECKKAHSQCGYSCNKATYLEEERKIYNSEELRQEKLLGIKCYNCEKEINQEGKKMNILNEETDCIWLCNDCFKKMGGKENG